MSSGEVVKATCDVVVFVAQNAREKDRFFACALQEVFLKHTAWYYYQRVVLLQTNDVYIHSLSLSLSFCVCVCVVCARNVHVKLGLVLLSFPPPRLPPKS